MKNKKSNKNIYPYVVGVIPLSEIGKLPGTPIGPPAYIDYDELYEARKDMRRFKLRHKKTQVMLEGLSDELRRELGLFRKVDHKVLGLVLDGLDDPIQTKHYTPEESVAWYNMIVDANERHNNKTAE